ncbi:MAG: hypothetical protein IJX14_07345 [Clostridia bacterium]|nr:hypothetical protein [Clostridia bacterium]
MIWAEVIRWAVPFVCGGIGAWGITYIKMRKKRESALENGVQCLLRAEIIRNHDKYVGRRYCPIYAKEALRRAYLAYHALGGNDVATRLYEEVMELPTDEPGTISLS